MSTSPFPWSEGESFVFDADGQAICREYSHNLNWKDDRALIAAIPEMVAALEDTTRMLEAVRMSAGRGSKQIGESLGISPRTVDDHREKFFRKIGATSVAHACWIVFGRPVVTA